MTNKTTADPREAEMSPATTSIPIKEVMIPKQ